MKLSIINSLFSLVLAILAVTVVLAQDSTKKSNYQHKMKMDSMNMKMQSTNAKVDSTIIRKGIIDLKAIDENNDGKVFQDVMDYNVISDKPGNCPLCGMTLKEVTLKQAKKILLKTGFKVK